MARITESDVDYVAGLARLSLDGETKRRMVKDLSNILDYIDKLNELDTANIEPMMRVLEATNVFREDVVGESLDRETALENAPKSDGEYFVVPRILDGD